jgi:hypothetical protein
MMRRSAFVFLGMGLLTASIAVGSGTAGCQSESSTNSGVGASGGGTTGTGGGASTTSSVGTGGSTAVEATITDITSGKIGPLTQVKITGAVAMSQKFFVSKGSSSNSCLWAVFVSEPGLTETKENSGVMVLSYGFKATINDAGQGPYCPRLGFDEIGDDIPDDIKPGDVVDVEGQTDYFLLTSNCTKPTDSKTKQRQVSLAKVTKTGSTVTPPTPRVMTAAEIAQLASSDLADQAFHDKWGGVKVRIENVTAIPQPTGDGGTSITDTYGKIFLQEGLQVGDKIYFRAYAQYSDVCYDGPLYSNAAQTFVSIDGFSLLDFCTWNIQPNAKCGGDMNPKSEDCAPSGPPDTVCTHE